MKVVEYVDAAGENPFARWFDRLGATAAAKVVVALARMAGGNFSNAKPVGGGVQEYRIDWGPGYRIYFCRHGDKMIILLGGGDKRRQHRDIEMAKERYRAFKLDKAGGKHGSDS